MLVIFFVLWFILSNPPTLLNQLLRDIGVLKKTPDYSGTFLDQTGHCKMKSLKRLWNRIVCKNYWKDVNVENNHRYQRLRQKENSEYVLPLIGQIDIKNAPEKLKKRSI